MKLTVAVHLNQKYHQRYNYYDYYMLHAWNGDAESVIQFSDCRYLQNQRPPKQEINCENYKQKTRKDDFVDAEAADYKVMKVRFSLFVVVEKKIAAFDAKDPLSPADFISCGKEEEECKQSPDENTHVVSC